jgi:hypothetical protein
LWELVCNNNIPAWRCWLTRILGPAHAVYFGTYEVVKDLAGGNAEDGKHHPGAAGLLWLQLKAADVDTNFLPALSGACATIASDALMNPFDGKNTHTCLWTPG